MRPSKRKHAMTEIIMPLIHWAAVAHVTSEKVHLAFSLRSERVKEKDTQMRGTRAREKVSTPTIVSGNDSSYTHRHSDLLFVTERSDQREDEEKVDTS